jgi:Effector-associated domain 7
LTRSRSFGGIFLSTKQANSHHNGLELLGAIKGGAENHCVIRNRIYERAFHDAFPLHVSGPADADQVDLRALREAMVRHYRLEELDVLCQDVEQALLEERVKLQVSRETVGGKTLEVVCLNLIGYLHRRRHLHYLVAAVRQSRPGVI